MPDCTTHACLTDNQLTTWAANSATVTIVKNCYTKRAGKFWIGTIFYCKKTENYYDVDAGEPFSADLRSMLLANIKRETPDA